MTNSGSLDLHAMTDDVIERVISLQRQIHSDPEIGFDTVRTAALAAEELRDSGLEVREGIGRTGVVADLDVPGATERIAFRADMDALPMEEDNDLPHKSRNPGAAHLCGHDAHTAMLLGAARALAGARDSVRCSLRFIFQPNEENLPGGAPAMIEDGCLEGVDRIFGMHVWPILDTGNVGILAGPTMGQPDTFRVELKGVGGHAAAPHHNQDVVVCAAQIVTAVQSIVARNVDPVEAGVISVTQIHTGTANNVIPESAELVGTIRSFKKSVGDTCRNRLREIVAGISQAMQVEAKVTITEGYPVVMNDPAACDEAERLVSNSVPTTRDVEPVLGGEDFAYYQQHVPGAFLFLGNRDPEQGIIYYCHHPRFRVDDKAMAIGVRTWLTLGLG